MITDAPEIKEGEETAIRPMTPEEKERNDPQSDVPVYRIDIKLDQEQTDRLTKEFFLEYDAIQAKIDELKLPEAWKSLDNQYDGNLQVNSRLLFNVHVHQSKIKVNAICRALKEAFLDQEPLADISPRPEMASKDGYAVSDKQTQFIDYAMDEDIRPEQAIDKIAKCSAKKFVGIGKICWEYRVEKRRREETYQGKNEVIAWQGNQPVIQNEALETFLKTYPDAAESQKGLIKRLINEGSVQIVASYKDQISNSPKLRYVKIEDFKVDNSCNYWEGLATTHCIGEDIEMSYWDLQKKVQDEEFDKDAVESLFSGTDKVTTENPQGLASDYKTAKYTIVEGTYYFKLKDEDEEEIKIKCWFGKDKKKLLGTTLFPYYALDTDYIPFYMELNDEGFYGGAKSVMHNLKDSNIAQDALLNLALHGTYVRNIMTPIVKEGSEIEAMFLEKTWREGDPISVDEFTEDVSKAFGFVDWPSMNTTDLVMLGQLLQRQDSDVTGVNDAAASGRNDPTDPEAPAAKTIALLQASGINIKDYIRTFLPSFNIFISSVLQLYYQMSQDGRKYKVRLRAGQVVGDDPFKSISRDEMVAKTNIQARAAAYVFDKRNEKIEAVTAYNTIRADSMAMQQPIVQYKALMQVLSTLGPRWKNIADKDFLSPEEFQQQQMQVAMQAAMAFFQQMAKDAQQTGVQPPIDLRALAQAITRAQEEAANPQLAVERQKQEKAANV